MARATQTRGRAAAAVVSYVGCSLNEPLGETRVVDGTDGEYLAEFLDRDECAPHEQAQRP
jgi:hypothetical protein